MGNEVNTAISYAKLSGEDRSNLLFARIALGTAYDAALIGEAGQDSMHKNLPLIDVARLERPFRRLFLDCEDLAKMAHDFNFEYAKRNQEILTVQGREVIKGLENIKGNPIYLVELNVPKTEGDNHAMDIVSFLDIKNTMSLMKSYVSARGLKEFSMPVQKGTQGHRYWSSKSFNLESDGHGIEKPIVKVRKRIHGTGYSLDEEQIRNLFASGWNDSRLFWSFAL